MRKLYFLFSLVMLTVLLLTGCGGSSDDSEGGKSKGKSNTYKEVETIDLEGYVVNIGFYLDETGDILYWGEEETLFSNDELGRYVSVDGEVESLDIEIYDHSTLLTESGLLVNNVTDFDREPEHSLLQYDPRTGEEEEFLVGEDYDDLIHLSRGKYLDDSKAYIHTITNADIEDIDTYLWDIETGEYTDLSFIENIKGFMNDEFSIHPQFTLTKDLSTVYALVYEVGVFAYDVESAETELIYETDDLGIIDYGQSLLTADERYFVYRAENYDEAEEEASPAYYAIDLETNESIDIGEGNYLQHQKDGNVMVVNDKNEVQYFDFETEAFETVYTIELEENMELDNVTISSDGSTIAYGYTETIETEEEDEENFYLKIVSNKS